MTRSLYHLTSVETEAALQESSVAVIPFGSVEQHGPHLPNGTDSIAARLIAAEVAARLGAVLVPFGPYGITPIHAGHAGTVSLRRATFEALLTDVCEEMVAMGVDRLVLVNWHEGNIAAMDAVATDVQDRHDNVYVVAAHACYVAQRLYAEKGGELTHGGGLEALAVLAKNPELVHTDRAGDSTRPEKAAAMDAMRRSHEVYGFITDVTEIDADGWYGEPDWAASQAAGDFAGIVAADIVRQVEAIFELRT